MTFTARVARSLEAGRGGRPSALAAKAWEAAARVARPLTVADGVRVVAVGGATLGGSGKTPLAVACAMWLARQGEGVAFIGHAYGARPVRARVVRVDDEVSQVGDEARVAARALAPTGVPVVVAPTRQGALDHAIHVTRARVVVLDGVGQLTPRRADLALLALDAARPWGSGSCPPRGDLRASRTSLVGACDRIVALETRLGVAPDESTRPAWEAGGPRPVDLAMVRLDGGSCGGEWLDWDALRSHRVGLWTALGRPERVHEGLLQRGVAPALVVAYADHVAPRPTDLARAIARAAERGVDRWLATAKCATQLPERLGGVPVVTLTYDLSFPEPLLGALASLTRLRVAFRHEVDGVFTRLVP